MAEETRQNEIIPPHIQDVIFNKPSLKELIRLIKNGSITAIWPSTEEEFKTWNNGGYKKYPRGQKLKSLKTSMTVYYGDNQDVASTGEIDLEGTRNKYDELIDNIDEQKDTLVSLNYFDNVSQIYPTISLSLNESTGAINNAQNLIAYETTILSNYKKNITKIDNFIDRIENFTPTIDATDISISDTSLETDYQKFFTDSIAFGANALSGIPVPSISSQEDVETAVVLPNDVYEFANIDRLYADKRNQLDNIINILKPYHSDLSYNALDFSELSQLELSYEASLATVNLALNRYFQEYTNAAEQALLAIMTIQIPLIHHYELSENEKNTYESDIEQLFTDKITPYTLLAKYLFCIKNPNNTSTSTATTQFWNNILNNCKAAVEKVTGLQNKIEVINNNLISEINRMAVNTSLLKSDNYQISCMKDGTIDRKTEILDALTLSYNILNNERLILNHSKYSTLVAESYQPVSSIVPNTSDFLTKKNSITTTINNIANSLPTDQAKVITLYESVMQEYQSFIQKVKQLIITPISPIEFIISINGIDNIDNIYNTLVAQNNKLQEYFEVAQLVNTTYSVNNAITTLASNIKSLSDRLYGAKIVISKNGTATDFNNKLLKAKTTDTSYDYTLSVIQSLIKVLTNNDSSCSSFTENDVIPKPTSNYLAIDNKDTVLNNLYKIKGLNDSLNREYILQSKLNNIESILNSWLPIYASSAYTHYTCIAVGSDIKFDNEIANADVSSALPQNKRDGSITIIVDEEYHYPLVNNLASSITQNTRNSQILTVGGLASLFGGEGTITNRNVGSTYYPVYINKGQFTQCAGVVSGNFILQKKGNVPYWQVMHDTYQNSDGTTAEATTKIGLAAEKLFGAVFNDYAEYRSANADAGRCIIENGDGTLSVSSGRLQLGANIVSDTFGFAIGETDEAKCPIAVSGRVLAYPLEDITTYTPGAAVCSGPEGTISLMSREEIREWPDAIVGYVSEIPTYDTWGSDNVPVNGRIWIKIK